MLSVSDSYYIRMIVYVLRAAHGERGAVHSFFELLRVSHILSGLEEHCVPCCGGSRNEAVAVEFRCAELWLFEEPGKLVERSGHQFEFGSSVKNKFVNVNI